MFILFRGHKPIPDRILGSQTVTLVVIEVKEEGFYHYLLILSQGEDASLIIFGLVRIQGGSKTQGQTLETEEMHCQSHLSVKRSQCDTGK